MIRRILTAAPLICIVGGIGWIWGLPSALIAFGGLVWLDLTIYHTIREWRK